jgi:hypothetical protein
VPRNSYNERDEEIDETAEPGRECRGRERVTLR